MDQVKQVLKFLSRHGFWFICGIVTLAAVIATLMGTRSMNAARVKYEKEIDADVAKLNRVLDTRAETTGDVAKVHPNQKTIDGMAEQIKLASDEATKAWELRYQQQSPAFVWPEDILGPATRAFRVQPPPERLLPTGRPVKPGETAALASSDDSTAEEITDITSQELQIFADVIHKRMPQIADVIGAKWSFGESVEKAADETEEETGEFGGGGGLRGRGGAKKGDAGADGVKIEKEVVRWRQQDQARWNYLVTEFKEISRLPSNRPTLPMALYIQQDLWLLEALFNVIKAVNKGADAMDNAAVQQLDHVFFGKDALGLSGEITPPNPRILKEAIDQGNRKEIPPPKSSPPQPTATSKYVYKANSRDFLDGRYVDGRFQPLVAKDVRAAFNADQVSVSPELIVAKRIPFRVGVIMDERKIPEFLAACANSAFRFEVRQIRINRHLAGQMAGIDGREAAGGDSSASEATGGAAGGGRFGRIGSEDEAIIANRTNYNVRVEFYGIVKLYNPVNRKLFEAPAEPAANQTASK
jgi:hypothetical protein